MAKNPSESKIPLPRAARPSFLPKPKIISSPLQKHASGNSAGGNPRSSLLAGSFLTDLNFDIITPRKRFSGKHCSSTPFAGLDRLTHVPSIWNLKSSDQHDLLYDCKDAELFPDISQQTMLEDIGGSCLVEASLGGTINESTNASLSTHQFLCLTKQNSFEHDESLGILTPDQMTDFTLGQSCLRTPWCESSTGRSGQASSTTSSSHGSRPTDIHFSGGSSEAQVLLCERSPSLEELPLDPKPEQKLLEQQSVAPLIAAAPSAVASTNPLPMSFVTSATSIASLEAGYQGDGENSRPASRGPDPPSVNPGNLPGNLPTSCRLQDPMTDSDFFTESDADAHEDIGRGDRKAQVIDGTLFCAPAEPRRRCPSFAGEEMDSSGIYSDLDKRHDELLNGEINEDRSPDTANTPDTVDTQDTQVSQSATGQLSPVLKQEMPQITMDFLQVQNNPLENSNDSGSSVTHEITVIQTGVTVSNNRSIGAKHSPSKADSPSLKKYKMPKKNVESKIKAMISTTKEDTAKESKRAPRRKAGHWDAVMSKIEAGKSEQRSRPQRKDVKSRVMQSLNPSSSSTPTISLSSGGSVAGSKRTSGDSSNSVKGANDKRRMRGRQGINSPNQETERSSVRSSLSDISTAPTKASVPKRSVAAVNQQRRTGNGRNTTTNLKTRVVTNDAKKSGTLDLLPLTLDKSPRPIRKAALLSRRPATPNNNGIISAPNKLTPAGLEKETLRRESNSSTTISPRISSVDTRQQATQTDCEISDVVLDNKRTETAVGALCLTIQYLSRQNDEYLNEVQALHSAASADVSFEQKLINEREAHQRAIRDLRLDLETKYTSKIEEVENALRKERATFEKRLEESLAELQEQHEEAIKRLKTQYNEELEAKQKLLEEAKQAIPQIDNNHDDELVAVKKEHKTLKACIGPIFIMKNRLIEKLKSNNALLMKQLKEKQNKIQRLDNELEESRNSSKFYSFDISDQPSSLVNEVWSLRSVLELKSQENSSMRNEIDILRQDVERKDTLEQRVETLEARCEDLKAQLQSKESYERDVSHQNEMLMNSIHDLSEHNRRLTQKNEELQYRLRQKNEVVSVLANHLAAPPRLSRSLGPEHIEHTPEKNASSPSPMIKFMIQKGDSVSWTLEIDGSSETVPKHESTPKVPRANSLRVPPRTSLHIRTRSKSASTSDTKIEENWSSAYNATGGPIRRRPRSDPSTSPIVKQPANGTNEIQAGPRPQEAGGEAMISEETSATSSEDESSASTDISRLAMEFGWSDPAE